MQYVRFELEHNTEHEMPTLSTAEIQSRWYNAYEYKHMRMKVLSNVHKLSLGVPIATSRGLEPVLEKESRIQTRRACQRAVVAQEHTCNQSLRKAYRAAGSKQSAKEARLRGKKDEVAAGIKPRRSIFA